MPDYPEPLSPQDCDLRNFPFMSLDVVRLRDSEVASIDPEAFRAAVLSWCAAWHQLPAGSLPDDDAALCRLLGYGRDLKTWMKVRAAGALHGYVKCSDNRIYHPVVAAKACEAWEKKQAQRNRTEAARLARLAGRSDSLSQRKAASVTDTVTTPDTDAVTDYATDIVTGSKGEERIGEEKESELCSGATAPQDARATLWRDGLACLKVITKTADGPCRKLMGRLVDVAGADHAGLLGLINRAETEQPDDPTAWLVASAKQLTCPMPSLFDVGDDYGLNAWTGRQPDVQDELDAVTGRRVKAINGQAVQYHARRIAEAAGLGPEWRGNWDALAAWFRGNIEITGQTLAAITRQAERMRAQGNQVASIAVFNEVVRASVRVAA